MFKPFRNWSIFRKIATFSVGSVLVFMVVVFQFVIPYLEERMLKQRAADSRDLVEIVKLQARDAYRNARSGIMDEEEAKMLALASITSVRYGENGYFWVHDFDNRIIAHPILPEIVSKDFTKVTDANGVCYIPEMTRVANSGGGVVKYLWPHPGGSVPVEKISYASAFPEWRWVIGTGIYTDDLKDEFSALRRQVAIGSLGLCLLALLVTLVTTMHLVKPLKRLVGAAARVANGDLTVQVGAKSEDEVGRLCAAFDSMTRDLSAMVEEMEKAQREREELSEQLHHSQKLESVGRLAGGVAHDFNNMLGVIIGYVDMLKVQVGCDSPLYEDLDEINKAAQRSATITRQLLAFARRQTSAPKVVDLNLLVTDSLNLVHKLIGEEVEIQWNAAEDLWRVRIDPDQFIQVFTNLAANARDAMDRSGVLRLETANVTIEPVRAERGALPGEYVRFTVSDSGCGIEADKIEKIFDPFYTTKDIGKGTGLGLSTVHGIVKQNGGFITVESVVGKSTSFCVHLPRSLGASAEGKGAKETEEYMFGNETILLVEDEKGLLMLASRALEKAGYRVLAASSPEEAMILATPGEGAIDLLLTDLVMPEMDGVALSKRLASRLPEMKCAFMSGYSPEIIAKKGIKVENLAYLRKPFTTRDLLKQVRSTLDRGVALPEKLDA